MSITTECIIWNLSDRLPCAQTSDCDCISSSHYAIEDLDDQFQFHLFPCHNYLEKRCIIIMERKKLDYIMILSGQLSIFTEDETETEQVLGLLNVRSLFHTGQREEIFVLHKKYQPFGKYYSPIFMKFECEIIVGVVPRRRPETNKIVLSESRRQVRMEVSGLDPLVLQQFCFCPCHAIFRTRYGRCHRDPIWMDEFETTIGVEPGYKLPAQEFHDCSTASSSKEQFCPKHVKIPPRYLKPIPETDYVHETLKKDEIFKYAGTSNGKVLPDISNGKTRH